MLGFLKQLRKCVPSGVKVDYRLLHTEVAIRCMHCPGGGTVEMCLKTKHIDGCNNFVG